MKTNSLNTETNVENVEINSGLVAGQHVVLDLGSIRRVSMTVIPRAKGDVLDQAWDAISSLRSILQEQPDLMMVTMMTLFVRSSDDILAIRRLVEAYYAGRMPALNFIVQAPCEGQALALEAWAVGGKDVDVNFMPGSVLVEYNGLRWVYISGLSAPMEAGAYAETRAVFEGLAEQLNRAGTSFNDVTRIWLYQQGIMDQEKNGPSKESERYRELNRSRTDFFEELEAAGEMSVLPDGRICYPPSTGIGMTGGGLVAHCMALQSERDDVRLIPLENPNQTAAFDYEQRFSVKSPKFSRAMAMVTRDYATTWVSGTASILDAESVHLDDIEKQTEQTIDNIEALVGADNFSQHGVEGSGTELRDFARIRVYVKRPEDYEKCRAVCERRFGQVPMLFVFADVCRPELLVEIEGVAFSAISS